MLPYILSRGALWAKGRLKCCERKTYKGQKPWFAYQNAYFVFRPSTLNTK